MDLRNAKATVMGLGHFGGGVAVAAWLARQGAVVTVTDLADRPTLADSLAALDGEPIFRFRLGGHREEDFRDADLVVVNPAVRPGDPFLDVARRSGARLSSEVELFLAACPARVAGVTGSNGKSTTAAMAAAIFEADGRRTWLGGNIGRSLLAELDRIAADDWVVLEISSFQLYHLGAAAKMPQVAVVTGCSPNHLDWHDSYENYVAAKQRILTQQPPGALAVLNTHDGEVASWENLVQGRRLTPVAIDRIPPLPVPGQHNRINAVCAATAAMGVGCSETAVRRALESFRPLPQRLERFADVGGRAFYSDSAATTPESTAAALASLDGPVWLLAGGRDKGCDFEKLIAAIAENAAGAAFFGQTGPMLRRRVAARNPTIDCTATHAMDDALAWCWERSQPGEAIVFSPGCPSTDQFTNYRQRGERFVELVRTLLTKIGTLL